MIVLFLLFLVVFAAVSLLTGADFLTWGLPGGLPAGTALAAGGLIAGAALPLRIMPGGHVFRGFARATMAVALLWLPLGWLLAGNPALNFVNAPAASSGFHYYTVATAGSVVAMILATWGRVIVSVLELGEFDE